MNSIWMAVGLRILDWVWPWMHGRSARREQRRKASSAKGAARVARLGAACALVACLSGCATWDRAVITVGEIVGEKPDEPPTPPATEPGTAKTYKAVRIWSTPAAHPNPIGMIAIPGTDKALLCLARIGYGSGYQSALYEIDKSGVTRHVVTTDNETLGHGAFAGPDGTIYLPYEHGSARVGIYRNGALSWGAKGGRWCMAGAWIDGQPVVASSDSYNGMFNDRPILWNAVTGARLGQHPHNGLIWWMWGNRAINTYGESVLYRDGKQEPTNAKVGASFKGVEVLGGGNRSGRGTADGRIWIDGKEHKTECQSFEHATTEGGRCLLFGVNPDSVYEVIGGKPVLLAQITGDAKWTGGWAFGSSGCVLRDGTILWARTDDRGGHVYRLDEVAEPTRPQPEPPAVWRRDVATVQAVDGAVEFRTRGLTIPTGNGLNADGGFEWIVARIEGRNYGRLLIMVMGGSRPPSRIYFDGHETNSVFPVPLEREAAWRVEAPGGQLRVLLDGREIWRGGSGCTVERAVMNNSSTRKSTGEWRQ